MQDIYHEILRLGQVCMFSENGLFSYTLSCTVIFGPNFTKSNMLDVQFVFIIVRIYECAETVTGCRIENREHLLITKLAMNMKNGHVFTKSNAVWIWKETESCYVLDKIMQRWIIVCQLKSSYWIIKLNFYSLSTKFTDSDAMFVLLDWMSLLYVKVIWHFFSLS